MDLATDSGSEYDQNKKKIGFHFFLHVYNDRLTAFDPGQPG